MEETLPPDHRARLIARLVDRLDLAAFYASIKSRVGRPGRPKADPRVLTTLWVYAMDQGVESARKLASLAKEHDAYRWLMGGVSTNHHQLSDFRVQNPQALAEAFEQVLQLMAKDDLAPTRRQALDGTKVRASAGAASFRKEKRLRRKLRRAQHQAARSRERPVRSRRKQAARERAWRERAGRVEQALQKELPEARKAKKPAERSEARASTTDPEARVMKMADSGFRPAYNLQFTAETKGWVILGVRALNAGTDMGQMEPMLQLLDQSQRRPLEQLADGGYGKLSDIEKAEKAGTRVYCPEQEQRQAKPNQPKESDAPEVKRWRKRMGTESAKQIYKERASTAELVVADLKSHGLVVRVRGLPKILRVATWVALAHNVRRWLSMLKARFSGSTLQFLHSL